MPEKSVAAQAKSDFVSIVSHELRTPLSIIKEGISLILDREIGDINEKQEMILDRLIKTVDRLTRITNDLLDVSKIEAGKVGLNKDIVNVNDLINQIASSFLLKAEAKGLSFSVCVSDEVMEIYADSDRVIQVLTNLVGNAVKFTDKGGIEVSVGRKGNEIVFSVTDTGVGIAKEDIPKVFERFRQFGYRTGSVEKGTGLGLSIAKGIVEMHGGKIWAESVFKEGSKFTFTLPVFSPEMLLRERLEHFIRDASERAGKISLIKVAPSVKENLPSDKFKSVSKEFEEVLRGNLRRAGDAAFITTDTMTVLLADCDKRGAQEVGSRLEHALIGFLAKNKLNNDIHLKMDSVTFPDDAGSGEELINKIHS